MDGIDAALVKYSSFGHIELIDCLEYPLETDLRTEIHALSSPGDNEIERLGQLDVRLAKQFARATQELLAHAKVPRERVRAIGSHGQTLRHRPPSSPGLQGEAFTLQCADPHVIAEITGITTVADFRRRDIAAGGEGAPLVPAFHEAVFRPDQGSRAIVNIGGIANVSLITQEGVTGFDTGPGNTLLDHWVYRHRGERYDANGAWGAEGRVLPELLQRCMEHPYIQAAAPKSTGKEVFNLDWLESLPEVASANPEDVQATLADFTATSIAAALSTVSHLRDVYVCGGGAANDDLMRRLYGHLQPLPLGTTSELGIHPAWVEAAAFAWLAQQTLQGQSGNVPAVTGAAGPRILGAIFPAQ